VNTVPAAPSATSTDAVTRIIAGAVCLVLIDAAQLLIFYPGRTNTLWAWDLKPEVTAMTLGSVYAGGAYFFGRLTFGAPWRSVAAGFPAVIMFVWMAAIASLFHLDRFDPHENLHFDPYAHFHSIPDTNGVYSDIYANKHTCHKYAHRSSDLARYHSAQL